MPAEILSFSFESSSSSVRIVTYQDGSWAAVGKDVCDLLGYVNHNDAMNCHCKGVAERYPLQTAGGVQEARVIREPDVYRLIAKSERPEAEPFERWIFEEVLPAIRKRGFYGEMKLNDRVRYHALLARIIKQIEDSDCAYSHRILIQQIQDICALLRIQPPPVSSLSKIAPQLTLAEV